jgi:hypothetical protein
MPRYIHSDIASVTEFTRNEKRWSNRSVDPIRSTRVSILAKTRGSRLIEALRNAAPRHADRHTSTTGGGLAPR